MKLKPSLLNGTVGYLIGRYPVENVGIESLYVRNGHHRGLGQEVTYMDGLSSTQVYPVDGNLDLQKAQGFNSISTSC